MCKGGVFTGRQPLRGTGPWGGGGAGGNVCGQRGYDKYLLRQEEGGRRVGGEGQVQRWRTLITFEVEANRISTLSQCTAAGVHGAMPPPAPPNRPHRPVAVLILANLSASCAKDILYPGHVWQTRGGFFCHLFLLVALGNITPCSHLSDGHKVQNNTTCSNTVAGVHTHSRTHRQHHICILSRVPFLKGLWLKDKKEGKGKK